MAPLPVVSRHRVLPVGVFMKICSWDGTMGESSGGGSVAEAALG